jgi:hypothetical protein
MTKTTKKDIYMSLAFRDAAWLREEKRDYGGIAEYFPYGPKSYCHEIHKKSLRLVNLARIEKAPTNESTTDNLLDLINYASYYYEYLTGGVHERE